MAFGGKKSSDIREGASLGIGIHEKLNLVEVKQHITEPKKGADVGYDVLDYLFKSKKGDIYQYRIFNPAGGDSEEKVETAEKNATDKVLYIASKLNGKEVELPEINSWEEFCQAAIALLPENYQLIDLDIKLIGNVYKGKANIGAPNIYNGGWIGGGWIRRSDSKEPRLTMSPQDVKSNAEYDSFIKKAPATGNSSAPGVAPSPEGDTVVF